MVRIGRQIPHFDQVKTEELTAVFSPCMRFRYVLRIPFRDSLYDRDRHLVLSVLLKNPSSADEQMADATIRKVETFVYHRFPEVRYLNILNLFARRATDATDLNMVFREEGSEMVIGPENDDYILNFARESDFFITAWGNNSGIDSVLYGERIIRAGHLIAEVPARKMLQVVGPRETVQPLHGLMWGYDYDIVPYFDLKRKKRNDFNR